MELTPDVLCYIALRVQSSLNLISAAQLEHQAIFIRQALRELPIPKEAMQVIEDNVKEALKAYTDEWWKTFKEEKMKELEEDAEKVKKLKAELEIIQKRFTIKK